MHLVISQPMLLPWIGMFEQVRLCDLFVFYDDVQLPLGGGRGRGFITRVQIKTANGIDWLSLPILRAGKGRQLIKDARFLNLDWKREHLGKIVQAYRNAPHFESVIERVVRPVYAFESDSVSKFCINSMTEVWRLLGLAPRVHVSSKLGIPVGLDSSDRILAICRQLGASDYISGLGAMNYIDYRLFDDAGVHIHYMDYHLPSYPQLHGKFTPYVSILDLLFNVGIEGARSYLMSGCVYWQDWPRKLEGRPVR